MENKSKITLSVIGVVLSIALLVISTVLVEENIINHVTATVLIVVSVVLVLVAIFYAARVDYETCVYKCRKCGHKFKPTFKSYVWGSHTLTTRYLKCPECNEKSWCTRKKMVE